MAYVPNSGSVVAFQSDPTKLVATVSVVGILPVQVQASVGAVIIGGSIAASFTPPDNQSVSGTVNVGNFPASQNVNGSVVAFQGTSPWLVVPTSGSVAAVQSGTRITSLVSTIPSSVIVGASIFGQLPAGTAMLGSVVTYQGVTPWLTVPTSGSVTALQGGTRITSLVSTVPSSVIVGASIFGQLPAGTAPLGSVAVLQGTNPWASTNVGSIINVWQAPSIVGTYAEDSAHTTADRGIFVLGVRNDAVASFAAANLEYGPMATDPAGRTLIRPFAPEEARIEGYHSVVSTSVTTLVAAAGAGLRNYITDAVIVNTGATTTLITFRSGGGTSVVGYGVAPTGGGSNMLGFTVPMRTLANETFDFQATSASSIIYVKVSGFKAP